MKTKSRKRCLVNVGRWVSYAAAGAVTAVAASNDAEAGILYSGALNTPLVGESPPHNQSLYASVKTLIANSDPGAKILGRVFHRIQTFPFPSSHRVTYTAKVKMLNAGANLFKGRVRGSVAGYASKLALGANISGGPFNASNAVNEMAKNSLGGHFEFGAAGTGFLGFSFNAGAGIQYGWIRVTMNGPKQNNFTLVDYAYGTPGQAIAAGEEAVPEPASLALLALGAAGLLVARMNRNREAKPHVN